MISDLKDRLEKIKSRIADLKKSLNIGELQKKQKRLEEESLASDLWNDPQKAQKILQELKAVTDSLASFLKIEKQYDSWKTIFDLYQDEKEADQLTEQDRLQAEKDINSLEKDIETMEFSTLLGAEHDRGNAILSINAGAGGTDAQDWADILFRMYLRWAESKGYQADIADISYGEQAGIKNAVLFIRGMYAYGYLKSETGIHRLVRMSPFNADGKRHTSFAAVEVIPESGEELMVEIKPDDIRIDTFRASGPGGQNVQKVESAIRITHVPTGIVAQSQSDRSQHKNKEIAMKLLTSRLKDLMEQEHKDKIDELRGEQKQIAWGSQIRSYVFAPYQMVKDHRTNAETGNVQKVIDGDIDLFIQAYLKKN